MKVGDKVQRKLDAVDKYQWPYGRTVLVVKDIYEASRTVYFEGNDPRPFSTIFFELAESSLDEEITELEAKLKTLRDKRDKEKFSDQLNAALKEMDEKFAPLATRGVATQYRVMGDDYTFVLTCSRT